MPKRGKMLGEDIKQGARMERQPPPPETFIWPCAVCGKPCAPRTKLYCGDVCKKVADGKAGEALDDLKKRLAAFRQFLIDAENPFDVNHPSFSVAHANSEKMVERFDKTFPEVE
mgnify:FL=1